MPELTKEMLKAYQSKLRNIDPRPQHEGLKMFSPYHYIKWLNKTAGETYEEPSDLKTAVTYLLCMDQMFPGVVDMAKVRSGKYLTDAQCKNNYKLLEKAFNMLNVRKQILLEPLASGDSEENFRFLQWFKKFYEENYLAVKAVEKAIDLQSELGAIEGDMTELLDDLENVSDVMEKAEKSFTAQTIAVMDKMTTADIYKELKSREQLLMSIKNKIESAKFTSIGIKEREQNAYEKIKQ